MLSAARRLGVLGWPVAHSRSPEMHNAALAAAGLSSWRYQLLPVPVQLFDLTVRALEGAGFVGANVTIPHKEAALALAGEASPTAQAIGAANTLLFRDGRIRAENTDAPALIDVLPFAPNGKTALVLGAGGSARAAVWALLSAGAASVMIFNRTAARAERLAKELGARPVQSLEPADLLVQCTPIGLQGQETRLKSIDAMADEVTMFGSVVDLVYADAETALIAAARRAGVPARDGFDVLVAQGALSFELFTGLAAPVQVMREAARK